MGSKPLFYRRGVYNPWHCGCCFAVLIDYDLDDPWNYCPTCGEKIEHPGYDIENYKRITQRQRSEGLRRMAGILPIP